MANGLSLNLDQPAYVAAYAELQRLTGRPSDVSPDVAGTTGNLTVTSTLRDDHHTVVTVGGSVDARALRLLAAHFAGLLHAGTRRLVVDLSQVGRVDDGLLELMHRVEDKLTARGGLFELTGLAPPVLYAMDDILLAEVFSWYRAVIDDPEPRAALWSSLRCPQGLEDVAEPGSTARYRTFIDTAAHGRGERWGRRR
ncbi:STAS domain-containing protein [Amycolatopsis benzoatilytica]|uniref:STAS domain-containing protein n=1 Tax=Amycolatopsis benzoatilytica TaxID=346045 RepID=UPI000363E478|nr:STAS domain-containing protein [Amycolatopsis benzoatilytica]